MSEILKAVDVFSGIGGFAVGLEEAGIETVTFCEIDPHARAVLVKNFPNIPIIADIKLASGELIKRLYGNIDVICGGFPCTDISIAGKQKGLFDKDLYKKYIDLGLSEREAKDRAATRSGLWFEYCRLIKEVQPKWVIIENVDRLIENGLQEVLNDLAEIRYDAEWAIIPASFIGAKHKRQRIWIVAYPSEQRCDGSVGEERHIQANEERNDSQTQFEGQQCELEFGEDGKIFSEGFMQAIRNSYASKWESEPDLDRVVDGLSDQLESERKQRIKQLGNAVVPQIPELIGKAIVAYEARKRDSIE